MPTPRADTYNIASSETLWAGRDGPPGWVFSAAVGEWGVVPAGNLLSALNPGLNAALNPDYPSAPPWGAQHNAVLNAWNSMAVDPEGRVFAWGGGHADYGGNEPYMLDLRADTPTWVMRRPPTGSLLVPAADVGVVDSSAPSIAASATGFYSDGRPRPTHTYGSNVYVPGMGMAISNLLYVWPHVNGPKKAVLFNDAANDWQLLSDYSALGDTTAFGVGTCWDPTRRCIWVLSGGSYNMLRINVDDGSASRAGTVSGWVEEPVTLRYDSELDLVHIMSSGNYSPGLRRNLVFDPATGTIHVPPSATGTAPAGWDLAFGEGAAWDQAGARWLIWNGSQTERRELVTLTRPAGDPRTTAWTLGTVSAAGAVTPPTKPTPRIYNRFDYVPALGICVLLTRTTDQVHFYKVRNV